jgi:transposase
MEYKFSIPRREESMSREIRADFNQMMMFPACIEDWVTLDHPARFIRDFVSALDLVEMGFSQRKSDVGRSNYAPDLLLSVWLYGYMTGVRSSRKLEEACRCDMAFIWLTGNNPPDHNSLWRFWRDNKQLFREVFKQTVHVSVKSKLIGLVVHAIDGTKIQAKSSRDDVKNKKKLTKMLEDLDTRIDVMIKETEKAQKKEKGQFRLPDHMLDPIARKAEIEKALEELKRTGKKAIHPKETEASFMKTRRSLELAYNAQVVADEENGIIVAQDVVTDGSDNGQLVPMLDLVKENLGSTAKENVADGGYFSSSQIGLAESAQYQVLTNPPSTDTVMEGSEAPPYHTSRFVYDEEDDCVICPHGSRLTFSSKKRRGWNNNDFNVYRCRDHKTCPHRDACTRDKRGRTVEISVHYKAIERQRKKRQDIGARCLLKMRKVIVEPVFAWIKRNMGFDRWTVLGLANVKCQWDLVCSALNLKRLHRYWKTKELTLAMT